MSKPIDVTIVGAGMITNDLILPSLYHLKRTGVVGGISVCATHNSSVRMLKENSEIREAFPGCDFTPYPSLEESSDRRYPEIYKEVVAGMKSRQLVIVATPDDLHYDIVMECLRNNQNVLCVKPLVLKYAQAVEIEKLAMEKGLFVGVEYHKRFDRRSLIAKRQCELGHFGEFVMGEAKLIEPYFYRNSNFQNWFTCDRTDPFVYVGCHYVDLVWFITGIKPVEVSVQGVKGKLPNGNEGYLWANGRVRFENGALLSVTNGLGYPDEGAGSNDQALLMYFEGDGKTGMIKHDDQFRGVTHSYLEGIGLGGTVHNFINPDFYKLVPWEGEGYKPIGYGFDSVSANVCAAHDVGAENELARRQEIIKRIDEKGIIATPANSFINELVVEAARMSILNDGKAVRIIYGDNPHVE